MRNQNPGENWPAFESGNNDLNYMRFLKNGSLLLDGDILKNQCEFWDGLDNYAHY